jgi:hypothetical protein
LTKGWASLECSQPGLHSQVHSLLPRGPADKTAQIAAGDRLLKVDGISIDELDDVSTLCVNPYLCAPHQEKMMIRHDHHQSPISDTVHALQLRCVLQLWVGEADL